MYNSSDLANYWLVNDFVTREEPSGDGVVGRFSFDWKAAVQQLERWRAQSAATGGATPPADSDAALAEAIGGLRVDEGGDSPDDALRLARASADEAAAARRRVVPRRRSSCQLEGPGAVGLRRRPALPEPQHDMRGLWRCVWAGRQDRASWRRLRTRRP